MIVVVFNYHSTIFFAREQGWIHTIIIGDKHKDKTNCWDQSKADRVITAILLSLNYHIIELLT